MANPIVNTIKGYVDQEANKEHLIASAVLGAKSASLFTLQTGVKGPTTINLLSTDISFGDGSVCGFEETGTASITQRKIEPAVMKVNMGFCDRNLLQTFAQYQIKLQAGLEKMPFEEQFTSTIVTNVKNKLETIIWQGNKTKEPTHFNGILKIAEDAKAPALTAATFTSAWDAVTQVYLGLPSDAQAEDTAIFVSAALFRKLVQELVAKNLYHYKEDDTTMELVLPGTGVKVYGVCGLDGTDVSYNIFATRLSNLFYGTDLSGSEEEFKIVYDEVKEQFLLKILFSAGVQIAFPDLTLRAHYTA